MPIHKRQCLDCQHEFETITYKSSDEEEVVCEKCNSKNHKKLMSPWGLYAINGDNNASTPSKTRHKKFHGDG